jgi:hypothetical protein
MTVHAIEAWVSENWAAVRQQLMEGTYQPQPVRRKTIPNPGGKGDRMLGIPNVLDRLIQQAIVQVLTPISAWLSRLLRVSPSIQRHSQPRRLAKTTHTHVLLETVASCSHEGEEPCCVGRQFRHEDQTRDKSQAVLADVTYTRPALCPTSGFSNKAWSH